MSRNLAQQPTIKSRFFELLKPRRKLVVRRTRVETTKNIVTIVAFTVGAAWALITHVIPWILRPDDYQSHLILEATIGLERVLTEHALVNVEMRFVNRSRMITHNLGAFYNARGYTYDTHEYDTNDTRTSVDNLATKLNENTKWLSSSQVRKYTGLVSAGRVMTDEWLLAPSEEYTYQVVMSVPCTVAILQVVINILYRVHHVGQEQNYRIEWRRVQESLWYELFEIKGDRVIAVNGLRARIDGIKTIVDSLRPPIDSELNEVVIKLGELVDGFTEFAQDELSTQVDNRLRVQVEKLQERLNDRVEVLTENELAIRVSKLKQLVKRLDRIVDEDLTANGIQHSVIVREIAIPISYTEERKCVISDNST